MAYKPIPIQVAQDIIKAYNKSEVIIIAWQRETATYDLVTDGSTEAHKQVAAEDGLQIAKCLEQMGKIDPDSETIILEDPNNRLAS